MIKIKNQCNKNGLVSIYDVFDDWDGSENRILDCSKTIDICCSILSPYDAAFETYNFTERLDK